jgi:hypothetical protein
MADLTSPRNTVIVGPQLFGSEQPLAASSKVIEGCLVAVNGDGYGNAAGMTKATGLVCIGVAVRSVDNSTGAAGALSCVAISGRIMLDNGLTTDKVTQADVGNSCYALDNHTVSRVSSGASVVGQIIDIDTDSGQVIVNVKF